MSEDEGDEEEPSILNADSTSETWQLPWGKSGTLVEVEGEEGAEMQAESILGAAFLTESEKLAKFRISRISCADFRDQTGWDKIR